MPTCSIGEALHHLLNAAWFYEQHFVAHGADFETKFLQCYRAEKTKRTLPLIECTLQGMGLLYGTEDRSRSLAAASKTILGVEPPKLLQTSCWAAPRLSAGQIAYAASDAVLTFRLWRKMDRPSEGKAVTSPMRFSATRYQPSPTWSYAACISISHDTLS